MCIILPYASDFQFRTLRSSRPYNVDETIFRVRSLPFHLRLSCRARVDQCQKSRRLIRMLRQKAREAANRSAHFQWLRPSFAESDFLAPQHVSWSWAGIDFMAPIMSCALPGIGFGCASLHCAGEGCVLVDVVGAVRLCWCASSAASALDQKPATRAIVTKAIVATDLIVCLMFDPKLD